MIQWCLYGNGLERINKTRNKLAHGVIFLSDDFLKKGKLDRIPYRNYTRSFSRPLYITIKESVSDAVDLTTITESIIALCEEIKKRRGFKSVPQAKP